MNTKILLSASALVLGALGIIGTFMPDELLSWAAIAPAGRTTLLVQLLAALLFAFAMANWAARGSLIGGIYNRPLALGNLTHFLVGALALTKGVIAGEHHPLIVGRAAVYAVFAIAFAGVFFRSPVTGSNV
jgi:hypothetical protein